jgi:hypothetical protein
VLILLPLIPRIFRQTVRPANDLGESQSGDIFARPWTLILVLSPAVTAFSAEISSLISAAGLK